MMTEKKSDTNANEIQTDLSEIERDLTLRGLLWQSLEEWTQLVEEWTATPFDSVNVESLQKNVNKFTQTVYMLEKGDCMVITASDGDDNDVVFVADSDTVKDNNDVNNSSGFLRLSSCFPAKLQ